jgi:hypothetical protein
MAVEIRETTITPDDNGDVVRLYISDAERESPDASFVLEFRVRLPTRSEAAVFERLQHSALKVVQVHVSDILPALAEKARSIE